MSEDGSGETLVPALACERGGGPIPRTCLFVPGNRHERAAVRVADTAAPGFMDDLKLLADLAWSRGHPGRVAPIHAALAPDAAALEWARRVIAAEAASSGAAKRDGRMVDRPVVLQAPRRSQRSTR